MSGESVGAADSCRDKFPALSACGPAVFPPLRVAREGLAGRATGGRHRPHRTLLSMTVLLTIPCFNEAGRLPRFLPALLGELATTAWETRVQVVDDGSAPAQRSDLERFIESQRGTFSNLAPLLALSSNRGKGGAVRAAWDDALATADRLAFVDADGSLSPKETTRVLGLCAAGPERTLFASRVRMLGKEVERNLSRHLMGRVFASLVGVLIDKRVYDSQCGLKVLPTPHYRQIAPMLAETRFAFDVELLAALLHSGLPVEEIPVDWSDVPGSKVHPVRDTLSMLRALFRIRRRRATWPAHSP